MRNAWRAAACAALAAGAGACGGGGTTCRPPCRPRQRGCAHRRKRPPRLGGGEGWTVDGTPTESAIFHGMAEPALAARLSDGRIVVGTASPRRVRVFDGGAARAHTLPVPEQA